MGITKLMHMKESSPVLHTHLKNALNYILKPEKTKDGLLTGGNCGTVPSQVLEDFLETKRCFGKLSGRQGYHFVIAFPKGEATEEAAMQVVRAFCEEYLGDHYDYVYAVHNDRDHLHGHIIFNSIDRVYGYKYRYKKGDWEKYIQPITDKVCKRNGLAPLTYKEQRVGESYAGWKDGMTNRDIARADIDFAIAHAETMEEFFENLKKLGYDITRHGMSENKKQEYFSMRLGAGFRHGETKKTRALRNTSLGEVYQMDAIRERIKNKSAGLKSYEEIMNRMQSMAGSSYLKPLAKFSNKSQQRLYEASNYYRLPNPYAVPAWKVRNDMKHIRELAGQCRYLQETKITSRQELEMRHDDLEKQIRYERSVKKSFSRVCRQLPEEEREKLNRYSYLAGQLGKKDLPEEVWENFSDEFENLEQELPTQELEAWQENQKKSSILKSLGKEKRMVEKLLKETEGPAVEKRKDMEVKRG